LHGQQCSFFRLPAWIFKRESHSTRLITLSEKENYSVSSFKRAIRSITSLKIICKNTRAAVHYSPKTNSLMTRLVEEKKRLYDEFLTQQQKLNEQFATDQEAIDAEILRVGRQIARTDEGLKALVAEHAATQRELTNMNTKGLVRYPSRYL
jgi:hypothetical protein